MQRIAYLGETVTSWRVGRSTFRALPEKGARLLSWRVALPDGSGGEVIYWPQLEGAMDVALVRGGNPILFPFAGRTYEAGEVHFWRDPAGVRRPMPMHGFARQGRFELTRIDEAAFAARLVPEEEARRAYPFDYVFTVAYRFKESALTCDLTLANRGPEPVPWSAGHHFYFTVPWRSRTARADYRLRISAEQHFHHGSDGRLIAIPPCLTEGSLSNPAFLGVIHTGLKDPEALIREADSGTEVGISFVGAAPGASFITWTLDENAPFYCVEPWMGPPNSPAHHQGLHWVAPGETGAFRVRVRCV